MKHLRILLFLAALLPSFTWAAPAGAELSRLPENLSFGEAERRAVASFSTRERMCSPPISRASDSIRS